MHRPPARASLRGRSHDHFLASTGLATCSRSAPSRCAGVGLWRRRLRRTTRGADTPLRSDQRAHTTLEDLEWAKRVCVRNSDQVGNTGTQPRMSGSLFGGDSPAARTSSPRLSPRGARSAVGGIRTWVGKSGRRASLYDSTPIAALWAPGPNILQHWSVSLAKGEYGRCRAVIGRYCSDLSRRPRRATPASR